MKNKSLFKTASLTLFCSMMMAISLFGSTAFAASEGEVMDRDAIAKEVKKELERLINEEGILDTAIQRGINEYVTKQRATARAQQAGGQKEKAANLRSVSAERDHIFGNPEAIISLVEYSDFECPFCKRYHPTVKKLIEQNGGKVNWVYRHFPLAFHNPGATKEAEASECAAELGGDDAFWRYSNLIYQRTTSNGKGFSIDRLIPLAVEIGLDRKGFSECLSSGKMAKRVAEDYQDGVKSGITGTPGSIIINHETGHVVVSAGAIPLAKLQTAVDRLLVAESEKER